MESVIKNLTIKKISGAVGFTGELYYTFREEANSIYTNISENIQRGNIPQFMVFRHNISGIKSWKGHYKKGKIIVQSQLWIEIKKIKQCKAESRKIQYITNIYVFKFTWFIKHMKFKQLNCP